MKKSYSRQAGQTILIGMKMYPHSPQKMKMLRMLPSARLGGDAGSMRSFFHQCLAMAMYPQAKWVQWEPAGPHLPENVGTKPFELILVELKSAPAK